MKYKIEGRRTILGRFCLEPEEEIMIERKSVSREIREGSYPLWACILWTICVIVAIVAIIIKEIMG